MRAQRHVILRQTLEFSVAADAHAWPLQEAAGRAQAGIVRLIERCCDELGTPDRLHRIGRLELDLGTLDLDRFEEQLVAKTVVALRVQLGAAIAGAEAGDMSPDGSSCVSPRIASQWELLAEYLRVGRLPWWADAALPGQPQASLALLLHEAPHLVRERIGGLLDDGNVLKRLAGQFPDQVLARLAALLLPALGGYPGALAQGAISVAWDGAEAEDGMGAGAWVESAAAWRSRIWQAVLANAVPGAHAGADRVDYSRSVLLRLASGRMTGYRRLVRLLRASAEGPAPWAQDAPCATPDAERAQVPDVLARLAAESAPVRQPDDLPVASARTHVDFTAPHPAAAAAPVSSEPAPPPGTSQRQAVPSTDHARDPVSPPADGRRTFGGQANDPFAAPADAIPVLNAGLVILWPFLNRFLVRLELLQENGFMDDAARQRAAVLLHCLASGETDAPEYLLPLNKVLCGLPLDAAIEIDAPLHAADIEECDQLLAAVIGQVPILNKMSVAGFRGSFLLRAGMLGVRDGAWLLRVERETHDLVLDRFPWGYEWIKLPWMTDPMQVEW